VTFCRRRPVDALLCATLLSLLPAGPTLRAAQTGLVNARIESRSAAAGLEPAVRTVLASRSTTWIGYRVPMHRRDRATISGTGTCCGRCRLDPPTELLVLARAEGGTIVGLKADGADCDMDASGAQVIWLTDVNADQSVAWLASLLGTAADGAERRQPVFQSALVAIALHEAPSAVRTLVTLARESKSSTVRSRGLFWLAQRAGDQAVATIVDAVSQDPDTEVKKKAVFALSQLPRDNGVPKLIEVATTNRNPEVRKQAMFWLGQSNDPRALKFFEEVLLATRERR